MKGRITIDPTTRLEGHGRVEIFLNEAGEVESAYFQVVELRGFEKLCEGRPLEEMPRITTRICGVCPGAHHLASAKALDNLFGVHPAPDAVRIRELFHCAQFIQSHLTHFFIMAAPDFLLAGGTPAVQRNLFGLSRVYPELVAEALKARGAAGEIQRIIGGKATHPVFALPGGISKGLTEEEIQDIQANARFCFKFAKDALAFFEETLLKTRGLLEAMKADAYGVQTCYMSLVDDEDRISLYDGEIRVVDPGGREIRRFKGGEYPNHLVEHVETWTHAKFIYLRPDIVYQAGPLGRLNAGEGYSTAGASRAYESLIQTLGGRPIKSAMASHWARLVEVLHAAERLQELSLEVKANSTRTGPAMGLMPDAVPAEGVGVVEAPRGTLFHHYEADSRGVVRRVNIIVGTQHNYAAMCAVLKQAAHGLIRGGVRGKRLVSGIERVLRAFDPCLGCATHLLGLEGELAVIVNRAGEGESPDGPPGAG